jgi:D-specific alpha-keto acid dehydrogenase
VPCRKPVPVGLTVYGCEPDEAELFRALAPRHGILPTITSTAASDADLVAMLADRCISVGHKAELTAPLLRTLRDAGVTYVSTRSIGLDHIDLDAASALGIMVENTVYDPDGVADFTLMLILMALRDATGVVVAAQRGDFRLRARGRDLRDLTVGVVGVGNIGAAVVRRLHGFGCRVVAHSNGRNPATDAQFVSIDELLRASDVVTLHVPLDDTTHHLIGRDELAAMKDGAVLVNTGRGPLVDTQALLDALERGHLGGAALDVLEGEDRIFYADCTTRRLDDHVVTRLQGLPNVIVTPHTAYYTRRALHDTVERTLAQCRRFERTHADGTPHDRDLVRGLLGGA